MSLIGMFICSEANLILFYLNQLIFNISFNFIALQVSALQFYLPISTNRKNAK